MPMTLYQTRNRLGDQKSEQSSWRRCEAFPCHLCLTAALLHSFCGFLAQSLAESGRSFSSAFKDGPQPGLPSHQYLPPPSPQLVP